MIQVPRDWAASAARIAGRRLRKILVLGETDRGKSTYCRYLLGEVLRSGRSAALVDADVGQKDIGPPGTITLGRFRTEKDLARPGLASLAFVGDVSPMGHFLSMIVGTRRMLDEADGSDFVIINTTGLVSGPGRVLKFHKIEAVLPDAIVALQRQGELEELLAEVRDFEILRIEPAFAVRLKSKEGRALARETAFLSYFKRARFLRVKPGSVAFQRGTVESWREGLLCGLVARKGKCLGLGILGTFDCERGSGRIWTPVPARGIRALRFGSLRLPGVLPQNQ